MWAIPNLKSRHKEKTAHPCQFPVGLPQRLIRRTNFSGDLVLDPYAGVSSTRRSKPVMEKRHFLGCEVEPKYVKLGMQRYRDLVAGTLQIR